MYAPLTTCTRADNSTSFAMTHFTADVCTATTAYCTANDSACLTFTMRCYSAANASTNSATNNFTSFSTNHTANRSTCCSA